MQIWYGRVWNWREGLLNQMWLQNSVLNLVAADVWRIPEERNENVRSDDGDDEPRDAD